MNVSRVHSQLFSFTRRVLLLTSGVFLASAFSVVAQAESFQEALISSYNNSPRLRAERVRVKEVDENYIQARAQGRLTSTLTSSAAASIAQFPEQNFFGPSGLQTVEGLPLDSAVQVIQPLYQGGRVRALKRQAKSAINAAREGLRNAEQTLFVSVATAYVDVKRDEETARIRRNNVSVLARQEQAARDRFEVGEGTLTDISQAEARLAGANIGLAQAEAQLAASRASYERVVGHPPTQLLPTPRFVLPSTLREAQDIGVANNPQLSAAIYNQVAARNAVNVAKSASKPTVSIAGTASAAREQLGLFSRSDNASLALQLRVPLYSGGANKSRIRQSKLAVERLGYEVDDVRDAIVQTVAQTWAQLEAARTSKAAAERQVKAAEVAFEGVRLEQQLGQRDTLDVLNAEQEVLNAKLTVADAQRTVDVTTFQLLSVMGAFDADSLRLSIDQYDVNAYLEGVKDDGLKRAVDNYVPEIVKGTVKGVAEIPGDFIDLGEAMRIDDVAKEVGGNLGKLGHGVGSVTKNGVDSVTGVVGTQVKKIPQPAPTGLKDVGQDALSVAKKVGHGVASTLKDGVDIMTGQTVPNEPPKP